MAAERGSAHHRCWFSETADSGAALVIMLIPALERPLLDGHTRLLVGVVVDASAAYLRRQGSNSLADGAALAAADGVKAEQVYDGGLDGHGQVDPRVARRYTEQYLDQAGPDRRYPGLGLAVFVDGDSVIVKLAAPLDLPPRPARLGQAAGCRRLSGCVRGRRELTGTERAGRCRPRGDQLVPAVGKC